MEPRIVHREAFTVVGMKCRTTMADNQIPRLWEDFNPRARAVQHALFAQGCYGICFNEEGDEPGGDWFSYLAGVEVTELKDVPAGMESLLIPASDHAVFEHLGTLENLQQTYHFIYNQWLPQSEYVMLGSQDFELYDQRFKYGLPDSVMEIWIPVSKK
ncbi:MAG: GyrI-like domain-containing protein [Candidatus Syntrophosphaera sp.]|nr:GyrI-like domain-containing protein [Candidatus Syntrophosphaera sp.]